jgi:phosphate transport system substrate-binding protein
MKTNFLKQLLLIPMMGMLVATSLFAIQITGAGASFPAPLYSKLAASFEKNTGIRVNYQSIGSSGGINQIQSKLVDFGATDMPLKGADLEKHGLIQFPTVIGGVLPVVNLDGIAAGKMKLTGEILAEIYDGTITQWNDKKIQELNPDLKLPNVAITVIHRADGSGTTFLFTSYLSATSKAWREKFGANAAISWPIGIGGKGNEGVSSYVQRIKGSIGYVENAYVSQNKLTYVLLRNKEGEFVSPTPESFKAAAVNTDWSNSPYFAELLIDQPGKASWPITGVTFILMYKIQVKPENGKAILQFFDWSYKQGSVIAESMFYVPLPNTVTTLVQEAWTKNIKDENNNLLWK